MRGKNNEIFRDVGWRELMNSHNGKKLMRCVSSAKRTALPRQTDDASEGKRAVADIITD